MFGPDELVFSSLGLECDIDLRYLALVDIGEWL